MEPLRTSEYSNYMGMVNIRDRLEYAASIERISNQIYMQREIASRSQVIEEPRRVRRVDQTALIDEYA